jgi:DNA invertase Pin-like site-specific DNA recombinase
MTIFGYGRVSLVSQHSENQKLEIESSGYKIDYWFEDVGVSGKTCSRQRLQFSLLLDKIRDGETLVVSKLDRLGRDSIDVLQTIKYLTERNIKVIVLQLGNVDLTSSTGKLILTVLSSVSEMERSLIVERTKLGLLRVISEGRKLGRTSKTTDQQKDSIRKSLFDGESVSSLSRRYGVSRSTIIGIRKGV